jgi:hypothetical protein
MGSWDCYCAICGGPFGGAQVSRKPRTPRFRRRFPKLDHAEGNRDEHQGDHEAEEEETEDDDNESLESFDEEHNYDPEIISESDTEWSNTLHILGFNAEAPGVSK